MARQTFKPGDKAFARRGRTSGWRRVTVVKETLIPKSTSWSSRPTQPAVEFTWDEPRGAWEQSTTQTVLNTRTFILTEAEGLPIVTAIEERFAEEQRRRAAADAEWQEFLATEWGAQAHEIARQCGNGNRLTIQRLAATLKERFGPFRDACVAIEQVSRKHREACTIGAPDCRECNLALYARLPLIKEEENNG